MRMRMRMRMRDEDDDDDDDFAPEDGDAVFITFSLAAATNCPPPPAPPALNSSGRERPLEAAHGSSWLALIEVVVGVGPPLPPLDHHHQADEGGGDGWVMRVVITTIPGHLLVTQRGGARLHVRVGRLLLMICSRPFSSYTVAETEGSLEEERRNPAEGAEYSTLGGPLLVCFSSKYTAGSNPGGPGYPGRPSLRSSGFEAILG
ncbi:hypothetical protein TYRP_016267 [Tyrophagus putrescentiae]|nr:hypothetical protein TYRP_016267 [Tyrophagus putrescentiae]